MYLDLITLGAFFLIMVIGMKEIIGVLRRDRGATLPRCGSCGVEANHIEDFICRTCKRDVRQYGLILPGDQKGLRTLGVATGWTSFITILCIIMAFVVGGIATEERTWSTRHEFSVPQTDIDSIVFETQAGKKARSATGLLILKNGKTAVLDVFAPQMTCTLSDTGGRIVFDHLQLNAQAVRQWFAMLGLDLVDPKIDQAVNDVHAEILATFGLATAPTRKWPLVSTNAASSLSGGGLPRWVFRTSLMVWSSLWLAGIYKLLQPRARRRDVIVEEIALVK